MRRQRPDVRIVGSRREIRLDLQGTGARWLLDAVLLQDSTGKTVRINGEVYDLGSWLNGSLGQAEIEAIFRALAQAERDLAGCPLEGGAGRPRRCPARLSGS